MKLEAASCARLVSEFRCLGGDCEDTCCKAWDMQLDAGTRDLYAREQPDLLSAVSEGTHGLIMRRDPVTDYCVKFDHGLCSIHAKLGERFLGDACNFYPRATRLMGGRVVQTAAMSCPEVVRLMLSLDHPWDEANLQIDRLPESVKQYGPNDTIQAEALHAISALWVGQFDDGDPILRVREMISVASSLDKFPVEQWPSMASFYKQTAHERLLVPECDPADSFHLLQWLLLLQVASKKPVARRLQGVMDLFAEVFAVRFDRDAVGLAVTEESYARLGEAVSVWFGRYAEEMAPVLRRYMQGQISLHYFPFGGHGSQVYDKAVWLAARMALVRLGLIACAVRYNKMPITEDIVGIVQPLSRLLDHLADPSLSHHIFAEFGWFRASRLAGLVALVP